MSACFTYTNVMPLPIVSIPKAATDVDVVTDTN